MTMTFRRGGRMLWETSRRGLCSTLIRFWANNRKRGLGGVSEAERDKDGVVEDY